MAFRMDIAALVLAVLEDGPLHGYQISKRIQRSSESMLKLGEGQLYPVLHRLEEEGRIEANWEPQDGKPPRKTYRLTADGKKELSEQVSLWNQFRAEVESILGRNTVEVPRG